MLKAQDSTKIIFKKDTSVAKNSKDSVKAPVFFLLSKNHYQYINQTSPDTISRSRFLWYPLKSIEELFNYLPGYYLKYMDVGQVQNLNYDQLDGNYTGVFRNGRPINDLLDGKADMNLLSRNEISEIELTNGFGNFLYNYANGINVIQRQMFQARPYSEMSFWQDRYENLYVDANFHQNFFRRLNFNFGITKHSYDGKYTNSDFDKWLGRFNFNLALSSKVNAFLYANYSHIQRGLNEGVNPDTVNLGDKEAVFNTSLAIVRNPDAYEIRTRFDIDAGAVVLTSKDSTSFFKFQLFESNAYRKYADEENRPTPNGIYLIDNSHWINYGLKLQNVYNFKISNKSRLTFETEAEYNYDIIHSNLNELRSSNRVMLLQNLGLSIQKFSLNAFAKALKYAYYNNKFEFNYGLNAVYAIIKDSVNHISINATAQKSVKLPTYNDLFYNSRISRTELEELKAGIDAGNKFGRLNLSLYFNRIKFFDEFPRIINQAEYETKGTGLTASAFLRLFKFDIEGTYQHILKLPDETQSLFPTILMPYYSGNISISFHDIAFKNKLEYKIGLTSRMWSGYYAEFYDGYSNTFAGHFGDNSILYVQPNATLDFYLIAKINKATFGLTFENLLNRVIYTSGFYPYMDRGGFANVISRFNITWYFLN